LFVFPGFEQVEVNKIMECVREVKRIEMEVTLILGSIMYSLMDVLDKEELRMVRNYLVWGDIK